MVSGRELISAFAVSRLWDKWVGSEKEMRAVCTVSRERTVVVLVVVVAMVVVVVVVVVVVAAAVTAATTF